MFSALQTARPSRGLDDHFEYNWLLNEVDFFICLFTGQFTLNEKSDVICRAEFTLRIIWFSHVKKLFQLVQMFHSSKPKVTL